MEGVTETTPKPHSIVIIGGGPGGYEAALAGTQLGAQVTLIERDGIGGNAVLTDVVPSKTLIATADAAQSVAQAAELGIRFSADGKAITPKVEIDLSMVNRRLREIADAQSGDMLQNLKDAGVRIINGTGRLDGNHFVIATDAAGKEERVEAKTIILAVGATPRELPSAKPDGKRILTWKQLYNLAEMPEHMIVVGSGVTGAEFASAFNGLGCKVSLVSSREMVLPGEDKDAASLIETVFTRRGMNIISKSRAESVVNKGDRVEVTLADGRVIEGSHCLMAVGGIPNTADLGLEDAQIAVTESGHIVANKVARTSRANVAKMQGIEDGFIKLICSTGGTVIGGVVVGPKASELIYPIALAIENRLTVDDVAQTYTVYPSLTGSITDAARALHIPQN